MIAGVITFFTVTAGMLVWPVYAAPLPEAVPVETSAAEVALGSVQDPAPAADVQDGTTVPVSGVPASAPTLTVVQTDVDAFSLVGVTWASDATVTDTVVNIRAQDAGG